MNENNPDKSEPVQDEILHFVQNDKVNIESRLKPSGQTRNVESRLIPILFIDCRLPDLVIPAKAGIQALPISINAIFSAIFNCNWHKTIGTSKEWSFPLHI